METLSIFSGITPEQQEAMKSCFQSYESSFSPEEIIMSYTSRPQKIGVLLDGYARLYCSDADGNQSIIEELFKDSVFGEQFLLPSSQQNYYVKACKPCRVLFIDYEHIVKRCPKACAHHSQLVSNLFQLAAYKSQMQAMRINILTKPSVRLKLMTYLEVLCQQHGDDSCVVPMPYSALAEYLCLDRSAMMRELKRLSDENLITREGRHIRLIR